MKIPYALLKLKYALLVFAFLVFTPWMLFASARTTQRICLTLQEVLHIESCYTKMVFEKMFDSDTPSG